MSYFIRVGPGPASPDPPLALSYLCGGLYTGGGGAGEPDTLTVQAISLIADLSNNGCRYNIRRVNDSSGNRIPNLYVLTSFRYFNFEYTAYSVEYETSNPSNTVMDISQTPNCDADFSISNTGNAKYYISTVPFTNTSSTTITLTEYGEVAATMSPTTASTELFFSTSSLGSTLKASTPTNLPSSAGNTYFFLSDGINEGPVTTSPMVDDDDFPSTFYTIRSIAKIGDAFAYLTLYNPEGPTGPLSDFEFEKGALTEAEPFRFIARKKRGVSGSTVYTYDIQSMHTGLFLQMYRYTERDASGAIIEKFAISRSDISDFETEMEIVQGATGVFGAFKIRSYLYSNTTRGDVFLRFDTLDPWTVHAATGTYNEDTDGFEIFVHSKGLLPTPPS